MDEQEVYEPQTFTGIDYLGSAKNSVLDALEVVTDLPDGQRAMLHEAFSLIDDVASHLFDK